MTRSHLMLHHSFTADSQTVSWGAIERYHKEHEHWLDIGYHYGVEQVGGAYYALVGRDESSTAAACFQEGMNRKAIHICCVGNYDLIAPPLPMIECLTRRLVLPILKANRIPVGNIVGHRDYAPYKSCPGKLFDLPKYRQYVMQAMGL